MTALVQTSILMQKSEYGYTKYAHNKVNAEYIYQATVVDFDGDEHEYEVSARSSSEASAKAESLAAADGIQVNFINLYLVA